MENNVFFIVSGSVFFGIFLFFLYKIINYKKKWQKLAEVFSLRFSNKKNIIFPNELKKFKNILNDSNVRLNLLLEGNKNDFYWRLYKYIYIRNGYQKYNTIILLTTEKKFPSCLVLKKNIISKIAPALYDEIIDNSNKFKVFDAPDNLNVYYDNKFNNDSFKKKFVDSLKIFHKNVFFESIQIEDQSILFILDISIKNTHNVLQKIEDFSNILMNH